MTGVQGPSPREREPRRHQGPEAQLRVYDLAGPVHPSLLRRVLDEGLQGPQEGGGPDLHHRRLRGADLQGDRLQGGDGQLPAVRGAVRQHSRCLRPQGEFHYTRQL